MKTYTLHDLPVDERPRERLVKYGIESLSLQELLSLIFGRGVKGEPVISISQKLISSFGSLDSLSEASIEELKKIKGLGLAKACQLKACFEISRRLRKEENLNKKKNKIINSPKDIFPLLKEKVINFETVSIETLNSSLIHPRESFEIAIKNHAAGIIICHNHPSGELKPSEDDLIVTQDLVKAGKLLGIEVFDHLIITKDGYYSFKERKII